MAKEGSRREERDLIIELKTEFAGMREDIAAVRAELKDINSGLSNRVLNLESNSVSKVEMQNMDSRVRELEDHDLTLSSSLRTWGIVAAGIFTLLQIAIGVVVNLYL